MRGRSLPFNTSTYLRSTMGQSRLNNLMLLREHRDSTDELDLIACANDLWSIIVIGIMFSGNLCNKCEHCYCYAEMY